MTFEGDSHAPEIVGENKLPGHHNYFLGNDESRWRTDVPLYASVRYQDLYPGTDLRVRSVNGVPEYDLLLAPRADLSSVVVRVGGAHGLSVAKDGSLIIETELGPLTQPRPKTWQVDADGERRELVCAFVLRGTDRFGFAVPEWDSKARLTIDPALIWSTFLGASSLDRAEALFVDGRGVVTVAGEATSKDFPTSSGAYDTTYNAASNGVDIFVSRLDPSKTGVAQLVYSTFLGQYEVDLALDVVGDSSGVVTAAGQTTSPNFPTTGNAYDSTWNGGYHEAFVSRLDSNKTGAGQLIYSTFLGGSKGSGATALHVDGSGVATVAGYTWSPNFPTTHGAFDTINTTDVDGFISRLDMGVRLYGDVHEVSISAGGTQAFTVNAGKAHATRSYWIFGSVSGTTPGVTLGSAIGSVHIPLNPDIWTDYTIALANTTILKNTRSTLDATGTAQASVNIPKVNLPSAIGLIFHHAYLVYDQNNNFYLTSNAVPLRLVK